MAERPNPFSISVGILIALQSDPTSPLHQELNLSSESQQRLSSFLQECVLDNNFVTTSSSNRRRNNTTNANAADPSSSVLLLGGGGCSFSSFQAMSLSSFFLQLRRICRTTGTATGNKTTKRNHHNSNSDGDAGDGSSNNDNNINSNNDDVVVVVVDDDDDDDDTTFGCSLSSDDLCRLVLDYVNMAATSVDSLLDLMDSLRGAVTEGIVDPTSAHGIFIRKVILGFDQLSFETTSLLWSDLQEQILLAMKSLEEKEKDDEQQQRDNNIMNPQQQPEEKDTHSFWPLSASQIERALRKECFRVHETNNNEYNNNSAIAAAAEEEESFEEMEVKLLRLLDHNPELPAAHFLRFLNCIKHGERVGALDALHQYFDYAIIQGTAGGLGNRSQGPGVGGGDILQFAAILLASLHNFFGDHHLARMATDEAVRVAQQSMDAACVAFALGWIFSNEQQMMMTTIGGGGGDVPLNAGDLLERCASRAAVGRIRPLVAGANLSLTRYHLSGAHSATSSTTSTDGENRGISTSRTAPSSLSSPGLAELAWNSIQDASSDRPGAEAADDGAVDRPTHMTDIANSKHVMEVLARQKLVSAGVWDYFGQTQLSGISSFLALYCHADQMLSHDVITAVQNVARMSLYGSPSVLLSRDFDGGVLKETLAALVDDDGSESSNKRKKKKTDCIYGDAIMKLTSLWKLFRLPMDGVFLLGATLILHEWAIRRGEIKQATAFGSALESYLHPRLPNYWQVMIDVFSQKSLLLSRQGKWTAAKELLRDMIDITKKNDLKMHHASLLLQLALVHLDANPHQFTSALPPLLECLSLTDKSEMDGLHSSALSVLAQVHLRMRNPNRAIALLQASLPSLLQREHVWFQGEAFLTLAKSRLQIAKRVEQQSSGDEKDRTVTTATKATNKKPALTRLLRSAAKDLQQSQEFFQKCHDCSKLKEVFYLQARVWNAIPGEQQRRDHAAQSFLDMSKHLAHQADRPLATDAEVVVCLSSMESLERMALRREVPVM